MKKFLAMAALLFPVTPSAATASDLEGIWFGGIAGGPQEWSHQGAQITVQPTIIDEMMKVELRAEGWKGFGIANCIYYGRLDGNGAASLVLNKPMSNAERCPEGFDTSAQRIDRDTMDFALVNSGIEGFPEEPLRLSVVLRDLQDDEMATLPEGADIFGIQPGMTYTEAAEILTERGFAPHAQSERTYQNQFRQGRWVVFGKDPHENRAWDFKDKVTLSMETVDKETGNPETARIIAISREATPGPEAGLTIAALETALANKYGSAKGWLYYDRAGNLADLNTWCDETVMQNTQVYVSFQQGNSDAPTCGSRVQVSFNGDLSTGLARNYLVSIIAIPLAARDFWAQVRSTERAPIAKFIEAQEQASAAAPDL